MPESPAYGIDPQNDWLIWCHECCYRVAVKHLPQLRQTGIDV
jgi:hypothetical protein